MTIAEDTSSRISCPMHTLKFKCRMLGQPHRVAFCWQVFGVDLMDEPYAASWGRGLGTDWDVAAMKLGNGILQHCPRWIVAVTGVGALPGAPGTGSADEDPFFWGENLEDALDVPVRPAA